MPRETECISYAKNNYTRFGYSNWTSLVVHDISIYTPTVISYSYLRFQNRITSVSLVKTKVCAMIKFTIPDFVLQMYLHVPPIINCVTLPFTIKHRCLWFINRITSLCLVNTKVLTILKINKRDFILELAKVPELCNAIIIPLRVWNEITTSFQLV